MSAPVSLLLRRIKRLEYALSQCRGPISSSTPSAPSALNTSMTALEIPETAQDALASVKAEVSKSNCTNKSAILDKLSFLSQRVSEAAGGRRKSTKTRKSKGKRKAKKTRKH